MGAALYALKDEVRGEQSAGRGFDVAFDAGDLAGEVDAGMSFE
jgi:hypothetical protein